MPAINRDWIYVTKLTYTNTLDEYGQKRQEVPVQSDLKVIWKLYNQVNVNNPTFVDIDVICLTKDDSVTNKNQIVKDNEIYNVMQIIPGKYNQLFLKKS